jgi:hypothetical protein
MVAHDETRELFPDGPGRREAAFCHGLLSHYYARSALIEHGGDDAMHIADYIAIGLLIACMFGAATMVLSRR